MKKLVVIFAMLGLMFNVIGCKAKKAQDETEIVENADVEKIEAEDANFAGNESVQAGPVDESLQAALGEAPQTDVTATGTMGTDSTPSTDVVSTETPVNTDVAATPTLDESTLGSAPPPDVATGPSVDAGITETPVIETPMDAPAPEVAQNSPTDTSLTPDTTMTGAVTEMTAPTALNETPITETPTEVSASVEPVSQASTETVVAAPAANKNGLKKIADTTPYKHGDGYVNAVYIARPKEKLADISRAIYGSDKSKELKSINSFLKGRGPKAGEKIYYISPNRPTDSSRTLSFYEDTGLIASTYVAEKNENLNKISKKLLGYDNAWKEVWTTNSIESKSKLAAGESIRYWRPAAEKISTPTLAHNDGNAKIVESVNQMPEQAPPQPQQVAQNTPPPPQEMAPPPPPQAQELPPPPPPPDAQMAQQPAELPPPTQEMAPPPPPQEVAAAPVPPKQKGHSMEEEPAAEEGAMSSDTMMMMGVVAVLVAALALVLVRRNKKKKEAELASIEQNHVGT